MHSEFSCEGSLWNDRSCDHAQPNHKAPFGSVEVKENLLILFSSPLNPFIKLVF